MKDTLLLVWILNLITMEGDYVPNILVTLFHSVPHINISFKLVNSTFDPKSEIYLEVRRLVFDHSKCEQVLTFPFFHSHWVLQPVFRLLGFC